MSTTQFIPPSSPPPPSRDNFDIDQLTCLKTLQLASYLSIDCICCIPCCCFCGGCYGKYNPCILRNFPKESETIKPGCERFASTCYTQTSIFILMTSTCCGCCLACCGICTPCAKCIARRIMKIENEATKTLPPPSIQTMSR